MIALFSFSACLVVLKSPGAEECEVEPVVGPLKGAVCLYRFGAQLNDVNGTKLETKV